MTARRSARRKGAFLAIAIACLAVLAPVAPARGVTVVPADNLGGWDPTFSGDGKAAFNLGRGPETAVRTVVDAAGRVVVLANASVPRPPADTFTGQPFMTAVVTRFTTAGSLDTTWGVNGTVVLMHPDYADVTVDARDMVLNPLGGVDVLASYTWVVRLDATGNPATAFGTRHDGWVETIYPTITFPTGTGNDRLAARPGGGLFVGGLAYPGEARGPYLAALTADGAFDTAFDDDGYAAVPYTPSSDYDSPSVTQLATRTDGVALIGVTSMVGPDHLWAIGTDGAPITTFGDAGHITLGAGLAAFAAHPSGDVTLRTGGHLARFDSLGQPRAAFDAGDLMPTLMAASGEDLVAVTAALPTVSVARVDATGAVTDAATHSPAGWATVAALGVGSEVALVGATDVGGRDDTGLLVLNSDDLDVGTQRIVDLALYGIQSTTASVPDGAGGAYLGFQADGVGVMHVDAFGNRVEAFGDNGVVFLDDLPAISAMHRAPGGGVTLSGRVHSGIDSGTVRLTRLRITGARDAAFNHGDVVTLPTPAPQSNAVNSIVLRDGRLAFAQGNCVTVVTVDGRVDATVDDDGVVCFGSSNFDTPAIAPRGDGFVMARFQMQSLNPGSRLSIVLRAQSVPGVDDPSFGVDGEATFTHEQLTEAQVVRVVVAPAGIYVGTGRRLFRLTANGASDPTFKVPSFGDFASYAGHFGVDARGRILLEPGDGRLQRYLSTGAADLAFGVRGGVAQRGFLAAGARRIMAIRTDTLGVDVRDGDRTGGVPVATLHDTRVTEGRDGVMKITLDRAPDTADTHIGVRSRLKGSNLVLPKAPSEQTVVFSSQQAELPVHYSDDNVPEVPPNIQVFVTSMKNVLVRDTSAEIAITNNDPAHAPSGVEHIYSGIFRQPVSIPPQPTAPPTSYYTGANVAAGDVDGDSRDEIITGLKAGAPPWVEVTKLLQPGWVSTMAQFLAYDKSFIGGVNVAAVDTEGDGAEEIVTAPGPGGGPHVRVFKTDAYGKPQPMSGFLAYAPDNTSGISVAAADVNGDGKEEIITTPGPGAAPQVKVFARMQDGAWKNVFSFMAYDAGFRGGMTVAGADVNADGRDEVVTGAGAGGGPHVQVFSLGRVGATVVSSFMAFSPEFRGGVTVGGGNVDGDRKDEVITAAGPGGGPHVLFNDIDNGVRAPGYGFFAYEPWFKGGATVAVGRFESARNIHVLTGSGAPTAMEQATEARAYKVLF